MSVTAVSWGPWRAEWRGASVFVRRHRERGQPEPSAIEVAVSSDGETGLREAIWKHARQHGEQLVSLHDANAFWIDRLVEAE